MGFKLRVEHLAALALVALSAFFVFGEVDRRYKKPKYHRRTHSLLQVEDPVQEEEDKTVKKQEQEEQVVDEYEKKVMDTLAESSWSYLLQTPSKKADMEDEEEEEEVTKETRKGGKEQQEDESILTKEDCSLFYHFLEAYEELGVDITGKKLMESDAEDEEEDAELEKTLSKPDLSSTKASDLDNNGKLAQRTQNLA